MHKILVVEQNRNLRFLYKFVLSKEGYDVSTAPTKEAALDRIPDMDLVIADLDAPCSFRCSYEPYYRQKENIKVIINTGYPLEADDFCGCHADAVLTKSSNLEKLTNTIRNVLQ